MSNICGEEFNINSTMDTMTLVELRILYKKLMARLKTNNPQALAQVTAGMSVCLEALDTLLKERGIANDK